MNSYSSPESGLFSTGRNPHMSTDSNQESLLNESHAMALNVRADSMDNEEMVYRSNHPSTNMLREEVVNRSEHRSAKLTKANGEKSKRTESMGRDLVQQLAD